MWDTWKTKIRIAKMKKELKEEEEEEEEEETERNMHLCSCYYVQAADSGGLRFGSPRKCPPSVYMIRYVLDRLRTFLFHGLDENVVIIIAPVKIVMPLRSPRETGGKVFRDDVDPSR
ncbi:hypothetical protein HZH68_011063 [Vespula germanica]|uniref:Uncharacterized protein n=1 Tax=Vespula germanica TaxID=30212 RepID=A0A834N0Q1_VESGE|nr:hypothetical protein HZH68_011063 [Vespula germanica]